MACHRVARALSGDPAAQPNAGLSLMHGWNRDARLITGSPLMPFRIGLLLFPDITQLDMTGPYEVFIKFPDAKVHLVWKSRAPVTAGGGMQIMPTMTFAECPQLDLICVPGGGGMNALLND